MYPLLTSQVFVYDSFQYEYVFVCLFVWVEYERSHFRKVMFIILFDIKIHLF